MFKLIRPILFKIDPEKAHTLALCALQFAYRLGVLRYFKKPQADSQNIMGLTFPHPVGLAAGFDKNGDYIDALASLGFGFIEIGTITPKPQTGNPKPRLFRLSKQRGIINRMGFNNKGMDYVAAKLQHTNYKGILGINIGKHFSTPNELAAQDYLTCFQKLAPYASYITINISSPNTQGLRDLQQHEQLSSLLTTMKSAQSDFAAAHRYVPLVLKISPDLSDNELTNIAAVCLEKKIDGIIATNTSIRRNGIEDSPYAIETGGLSGEPLRLQSTHVIEKLHSLVGERIPIIASGGVMDAKAIQEKMTAGAKLVQVYSGFIYSGPKIICATEHTAT